MYVKCLPQCLTHRKYSVSSNCYSNNVIMQMENIQGELNAKSTNSFYLCFTLRLRVSKFYMLEQKAGDRIDTVKGRPGAGTEVAKTRMRNIVREPRTESTLTFKITACEPGKSEFGTVTAKKNGNGQKGGGMLEQGRRYDFKTLLRPHLGVRAQGQTQPVYRQSSSLPYLTTEPYQLFNSTCFFIHSDI